MKSYSKEGLKVIWKPELCIHSGNCFHGLGRVFNPRKRPWINMDGATAGDIIRQVKACPSGALSYELKNETIMENKESLARITVSDKGPYLIKGKFFFVNEEGVEEMKEGNMALCRCGLSQNKPFCDGHHRQTDVLNS